MGLVSRIARGFKRDADSDGVWSGGLFGGWGIPTAAGINIDQFTAMQSAAVMACVSILAEDLAKLPLGLYQQLDNGGRRRAKEHWLDKLLRSPNGWQTQFEFVEMLQAALVLRGNAYAIILRDNRGRPNMLVPINPDRVTLYEAPSGAYFYWVSRIGLHDIAVLKEQPLMIPSEDVLHIRWLSQWHSLLGLSRVALMREAIGLMISQEQQAARLAGTGARPSGVLTTDQKLNLESAKRLADDWHNTYSGLKNSGKTAVLEQGLKWQQITMSSVDAEFMAQREFALGEAARMFRLPPHKLGIIVRGAASTMAQQDQDYMNNVISSYCIRWEQKISKTFGIDDSDYFPLFDISQFLRADIMTRLTAYRTGVMGMIYTPNEARASEGLPSVEGGDTLYQPVNVAPIGFDPTAQGVEGAAGPGSDITGAPAAGGKGDTQFDDTAPGD